MDITLDNETDDETVESVAAVNHRHRPVSFIDALVSGQPAPVNCRTLRKQKVVSYPRNRLHYYNRVVKRKNVSEERAVSTKANSKLIDVFFFVLEYNEDKALLCLVPLMITGKLTGKRLGRPRYQCSMEADYDNFIVDDAINYIVVPSAMIMKTPIVAQDAWDITTENDADFATR
jgi:hypothetical protein